MRKRVYIAGPYSTGIPGQNVLHAIKIANTLVDAGYAPFVPHLSHYQNDLYPQPYELWMAIDLAWVSVAQAVPRLPGDSPGADREVSCALHYGIPIFHSIASLIRDLPP